MTSLSDPWILLDLFEVILKWRRKKHTIPKQVKFLWSEIHLSIVHHYFSRMYSSCDFGELPSMELFNDTLKNTMPENSVNYARVAASFTQELGESFVVPRLNEQAAGEYEIKKYRAIQVFISFLVQLLCKKTDSIDLLKDRTDNLMKELRFLRTVLGDTSLQLCDEHEQVNNLLEEFEAVANEAGSLVHSLLFSTDLVSEKMDEGLIVVLNHMDHLKANIMKFLDLQPLSSGAITPKASVLDSPLVLDSLLHELEVLIKREDNPIADVKDQIKMLHRRLVCLQSSIKDAGAPQHSEIGELKELLMRIGDLACEAEYLIISFLVGDASPLYLIIRLTNIIRKIELLGTELEEIEKEI